MFENGAKPFPKPWPPKYPDLDRCSGFHIYGQYGTPSGLGDSSGICCDHGGTVIPISGDRSIKIRGICGGILGGFDIGFARAASVLCNTHHTSTSNSSQT